MNERDARDGMDARDTRDVRDTRDARDTRDIRDAKDNLDVKDVRNEKGRVFPYPSPSMIYRCVRMHYMAAKIQS